MASLKDRVVDTVEGLRERYPPFDHALKMLAHYGLVNGNAQAGAVTYFGFLSVFPILALAAVAIGLVAHVYPDIRAQMTDEISSFLPGVVGTGKGEIDLASLGGGYASLAGIVGLVGVLYSGLNWLSFLRQALEVMFVVPKGQQPNFVLGKLRDLLTLLLIGLILMVSVVLSGAVTGFSGVLLKLIGIDQSALLPAILLSALGHLLAIVASTLLLLAMFKLLLAESHVPRGAMVRGAVLGGVGFEILKAVANLLIATTKGNAAFATFGVALILLVWINYFSRLVMYSAAWAYTAPDALEQRTAESMRAPGAALSPDAPVSDEASRDAVEQAVAATAPRAPKGPPAGPHRPVPGSADGRAEVVAQERPPWALLAGAAGVAGLVAVFVRRIGR